MLFEPAFYWHDFISEATLGSTTVNLYSAFGSLSHILHKGSPRKQEVQNRDRPLIRRVWRVIRPALRGFVVRCMNIASRTGTEKH